MEYTDGAKANAALDADQSPILLQFSADWCGPCRQMAFLVSDTAAALTGRVAVMKINIDKDQELAKRFNVVTIPNFVFVKGRRVAGRLVGTTTRRRFNAFIEDHL